MPTSKRPRKKATSPRVLQQRRQRKLAQKCRLYRWESGDHSAGYFNAYGPFDADKNMTLMDQAAERSEQWMLVVTSFFLTPQGDYYEEQLVSGPHQWHVIQQFAEVRELIEAAINDTKQSGNFKEYQDTCSALYLYSPELEAALNNDAISTAQAGKRAQAAFAKYAAAPT